MEEKYYEALLKVSEWVSHLEEPVETQLILIRSKDKAFKFISDPVFALKASQSLPPLKSSEANGLLPPLKISEASGSKSKIQFAEIMGLSKFVAVSKDKGKVKMHEESPLYDNGLLSNFAVEDLEAKGLASKNLDARKMVFSNGSLSQKSISELVEEDLGNEALISQKAMAVNEEAKSFISIPEEGLGKEAMDYLQDSLFNMIDPPLRGNSLMGVEEMIIELAMFEETRMKHVVENNKPYNP